MPDHTDMHIGDRLRDIRKRRGMTQRDIAQASGVSLSLIRKLEQGEIQDTRLETARRLATALRVPTTRLVQRDSDPADAATTDQWEPVRRALADPLPTTPIEEEPTVAGVTDALRGARTLRESSEFAQLATVLPALLRDADALNSVGSDARQVRVQLLQLTGWLLTQTHQYEAADAALDRALAEASDRLDGAAVINSRCWLLLRQGRLEQARQLAARWADEVEPRMSRATAPELHAWGWMLIRLSAAAVRDNRASEARDALKLARTAATALGREHTSEIDYPRAFGPQKVQRQCVEQHAVTDEPDRVLALAGTMTTEPVSNKNRRVLLDVADAYAKTHSPADAVSTLRGILAVSPEWLPQQRYAKDIMGRVIGRRRTLTPEMREVADALGMPM